MVISQGGPDSNTIVLQVRFVCWRTAFCMPWVSSVSCFAFLGSDMIRVTARESKIIHLQIAATWNMRNMRKGCKGVAALSYTEQRASRLDK